MNTPEAEPFDPLRESVEQCLADLPALIRETINTNAPSLRTVHILADGATTFGFCILIAPAGMERALNRTLAEETGGQPVTRAFRVVTEEEPRHE